MKNFFVSKKLLYHSLFLFCFLMSIKEALTNVLMQKVCELGSKDRLCFPNPPPPPACRVFIQFLTLPLLIKLALHNGNLSSHFSNSNNSDLFHNQIMIDKTSLLCLKVKLKSNICLCVGQNFSKHVFSRKSYSTITNVCSSVSQS